MLDLYAAVYEELLAVPVCKMSLMICVQDVFGFSAMLCVTVPGCKVRSTTWTQGCFACCLNNLYAAVYEELLVVLVCKVSSSTYMPNVFAFCAML